MEIKFGEARNDWFNPNASSYMNSYTVRSKRNGYISEFNLHKDSTESEIYSRAIQICSYFRGHQFEDLEII